jgi:hypothetical protein
MDKSPAIIRPGWGLGKVVPSWRGSFEIESTRMLCNEE